MPSILAQLRSKPTATRDAFSDHFLFNGQAHALHGTEPLQTMPGSPQEAPPQSFEQTIRVAHRRNGVVAASVTARALLLSELRFVWRSEIDGARFGSSTLAPLERPHDGLTRSQLLWRLEQDVSYLGNAYVYRLGDGSLRRLRPDWVRIVLASDESPEDVARGADVVPMAYMYGRPGDADPKLLPLGAVAHVAPEPDPTAHYRGESWVSGVVRELLIDLQATDHLGKYLTNAATANMVVKAPENVATADDFNDWVDVFDAQVSNSGNAWRNIYLGGGADVQVVGANLADLDLKGLQGGLETRVAARSRVPAAILGIREGLQGAALNAGNYGATRRLWADSWFEPYAQSVCASLERIVARPTAAELTFDRDRVLFLQEDQKDAADIFSTTAAGMRQLVDGGFDPLSVIDAASKGDLAALTHSGNLSVQLQPDGITPKEGSTDE